MPDSVKPQKAETRATHGGTENHYFVCAGNVRQLQVLGKLGVAAGISKDSKAGGNKYNGECGQAVQTVGQVNGIGCADDGQVGQYQETDYAKRQGNLFEEGNNQDIVGGICSKVEQCQTGNNGNAGLPHHFKIWQTRR